LAFLLATAALVGMAGCSPRSPHTPAVVSNEQVSPDAIVVPSNVPWTDTGIDVVAGRPLTIVGKGRVASSKLKKVKNDAECEVGPRGTYFYGNHHAEQEFPLPRSEEHTSELQSP
jgi:hypothetical protein